MTSSASAPRQLLKKLTANATRKLELFPRPSPDIPRSFYTQRRKQYGRAPGGVLGADDVGQRGLVTNLRFLESSLRALSRIAAILILYTRANAERRGGGSNNNSLTAPPCAALIDGVTKLPRGAPLPGFCVFEGIV